MNILHLIYTYLGMTLVFFAIDMVWLGVVAKNFYRKYLGNLLLDDFKWGPAFSFYFIFLVGILIFAVLPAAEKNSWISAFIMGGLFGFFCYATYDLTNWATLKNWPWQIVFIDMLWGFLLCAVVSTAGFYILSFLK